MKEKTIKDLVEFNPKDFTFEERARKFEAEQAPLMQKWGVQMWAGVNYTQDGITAVPLFKDLWPKEEEKKPLIAE